LYPGPRREPQELWKPKNSWNRQTLIQASFSWVIPYCSSFL
jgi:hypothetical protein